MVEQICPNITPVFRHGGTAWPRPSAFYSHHRQLPAESSCLLRLHPGLCLPARSLSSVDWASVSGFVLLDLSNFIQNCIVGLHRKEVQELLDSWNALPNEPTERQRYGRELLETLLRRDKEFLICRRNEYLDFPGESVYFLTRLTPLTFIHFFISDYPIKVLPYPEGAATAELPDILHDILSIPENSAGKDVDAIITSTSGFVEEVVSGRKMVSNFLKYTDKKTNQIYENLALPFSVPIQREVCSSTNCGVGRIDTSTLIPDMFYGKGKILLVDPNGWSSTFIVAPAYTPMHNDHYYSGQVIAHQLGDKASLIIASLLFNCSQILGFRPGSSVRLPKRIWISGFQISL